jgi:sigma-B regulation protein RsbU (phosphoserine phosphatase)
VTIEPSGRTRVRVAGHPAPLLCHGGTARYLEVAVGPPLGLEVPGLVDPAERWPATELQTRTGDSLILYTDGLLDAHADGGKGIGIERLVGRITANLATGEPVRTWLPAIVSAAPRQSGDDIAIVVLAVEGPTR